jgi:hypothetical protein
VFVATNKRKKPAASPAKRRPGPTSIRFSPEDIKLLEWLQNHYGTNGPTTTLRHAMLIAKEHAK